MAAILYPPEVGDGFNLRDMGLMNDTLHHGQTDFL